MFWSFSLSHFSMAKFQPLESSKLFRLCAGEGSSSFLARFSCSIEGYQIEEYITMYDVAGLHLSMLGWFTIWHEWTPYHERAATTPRLPGPTRFGYH